MGGPAGAWGTCGHLWPPSTAILTSLNLLAFYLIFTIKSYFQPAERKNCRGI